MSEIRTLTKYLIRTMLHERSLEEASFRGDKRSDRTEGVTTSVTDPITENTTISG